MVHADVNDKLKRRTNMMVSRDEAEDFQHKFRWMNNWMTSTLRRQVSVFEILATIMVMEKEDPSAIVSLMLHVQEYENVEQRND